MATYGRGRHILPSIQSVLAQGFRDFELIVVGDQSTDETASLVQDLGLHWINLPTRCGSQSGPNNAGIAAARGDIIAYLGHDDLWEPDHLQRLVALFDADPSLGFGVSGAIYHLPDGIPGSLITGLFTEDSAKHRHFFPPSSFAHRKSVCARIGLWAMPMQIRAPVDADFLLRAAAADLRFASTGVITVHKFAAGHRYLSYLHQDSDEQQDMLAAMTRPDHPARVAALVADAKRCKSYMISSHPDYSTFGIGTWARQNEIRKGLRAQVSPFPGTTLRLPQTPSDCALDWQETPSNGVRWSYRTPRPRFLLPYSGAQPIRLDLRLFHRHRSALSGLTLTCNGQSHFAHPLWRLPYWPGWRGGTWQAAFRFVLDLQRDAPSVLTFDLTSDQAPAKGRRGIGLGPLTLSPAQP
jgi:hypothetical protein